MISGWPARRALITEVIQTSAMDCGAAALKCLLDGFGIPASYGRLREACQTDVDGTSIDAMAEIACQLGLDAEQVISPVEHLLLNEAAMLPAIVVVKLPNGFNHFVVIWNQVGGLVQVMDPAVGRRWIRRAELLDQLYVHTLPIPTSAFREWASLDGFLRPIGRRLANLGVPDRGRDLQEAALADPGWRSLAALDAATRLGESLVRSGALSPGREVARLLAALLHQTKVKTAHEEEPIPDMCWSVRQDPRDGGDESVLLRGAVLVCVHGKRGQAAGGRRPTASERETEIGTDLAAVLREPAARSWRILFQLAGEDGLWIPSFVVGGLIVTTAGRVAEALLYRGLLQLAQQLPLPEVRIGASAVVLLFVAALLVLELPIASATLHAGRALEARLRIAFLSKIPRLGDRYFSSRPTSDMAERSHTVHEIREGPALAAQLVRSACGLVVTVLAIGWIDAESALSAAMLAALCVLLPLALNAALVERDMRVRTHAGALTRFYLDALMGLVAIRSHAAERAVRREHEALLAEWKIAGTSMLRAALLVEGTQSILAQGGAVLLFFDYFARQGPEARSLLFLYWVLALPARGQEIAGGLRRYPSLRNIAMRLLEPLGAPDDTGASPEALLDPRSGAAEVSPVSIAFKNVSVRAGGNAILLGIDVFIAPGSHVAVVGPSGAGKSSLFGLLLGWHRPAEGSVLIDDIPHDGAGVDRLRRSTAWVDPSVQIWNRSLLENLRYGAGDGLGEIAAVMEAAELRDVLERLPEGQQTVLGEGGGLVSGGEGQRIRLGRAMLRSSARLVILDEPFRGLDREKRRTLLARARRMWRRSTLLCGTHDIGETRSFERVLVMDRGRIVEDGAPAELATQTGSRYRALLEAEETVRTKLWSGAEWRRLRMEDGRLVELKGEGNE